LTLVNLQYTAKSPNHFHTTSQTFQELILDHNHCNIASYYVKLTYIMQYWIVSPLSYVWYSDLLLEQNLRNSKHWKITIWALLHDYNMNISTRYYLCNKIDKCVASRNTTISSSRLISDTSENNKTRNPLKSAAKKLSKYIFLVNRRLHHNIKSMQQERTSEFQYVRTVKNSEITLKCKNSNHIWIQRPRLPYSAPKTGSKSPGQAMCIMIAVPFLPLKNPYH